MNLQKIITTLYTKKGGGLSVSTLCRMRLVDNKENKRTARFIIDCIIPIHRKSPIRKTGI